MTNELKNKNLKNTWERFASIADNAVYVLFFILMLCSLCILLYSNTVYSFKVYLNYSNILLLVYGILTSVIVLLIVSFTKDFKVNINKLTLVLFLLISYISFNIAFQFKWDNYFIIRNAQLIVGGAESKDLSSDYFSMYPNNFFLLMIFTLILKIHNVIGIFTMNGNYMPVILFQCALMSMAARTLYLIIYDMCKKHNIALFGFLLYSFSIVLSGMSVITYSDQVALIFPLLVLRLFQLMDNKKHILLKVIGIIVCSYTSMIIKPPTVIPLIAILMYAAVHSINKINKNIIKYIVCISICIAILITGHSFVKDKFIAYSGLEIEKNGGMSPWHFVMMGLNKDTQGLFSGDDVQFSKESIKNHSNGAVQKEVAISRFQELINSGEFLSHLERKILNSLGDGSYYWHQVTTFKKGEFEDLNYHVTPFLKTIYLREGKIDKIAFQQSIWLTMLFISLFSIFLKKNKEQTVMILSLIGFVLFMLIFEAGPRTLMNFISYYIILSMMVLSNLSDIIMKKLNKK